MSGPRVQQDHEEREAGKERQRATEAIPGIDGRLCGSGAGQGQSRSAIHRKAGSRLQLDPAGWTCGHAEELSWEAGPGELLELDLTALSTGGSRSGGFVPEI